MNKYCPRCGNVVNENDNFCGYCRNSLNNNIEQMNNQNMINNNINNVNQNMNQTQNVSTVNNNQNINTVKTNTFAITGFIMSIASPALCCGLLSLPSLIVSIIGLSKVNKTKENGKGLAIAGIIISAITLFAYILYIILIMVNLIGKTSYIPNGIDA